MDNLLNINSKTNDKHPVVWHGIESPYGDLYNTITVESDKSTLYYVDYYYVKCDIKKCYDNKYENYNNRKGCRLTLPYLL